jgi:uncharacterized protein (TIGR00369 family)
MKFPRHIPFVELLGFDLLKFEGGEAEIAVDLREELKNSWGMAHGGVTMTLLDVAMAHAARSPQQPGGEPRGGGLVTIEMKTSFMRPGVGKLTAKARILQGSASLAFCEGLVYDEKGTLTAHATGTFKYLDGITVGDKRVERKAASD